MAMNSLWSCEEGPGVGVEINWRRVMALLESGQGEDVNERPNQMTMLHWAVEDREVAAIKALLRHGADATLGRNGGIPYTPLMRAASYGYDECVAALVSGGADVNYCTPADGTFVSGDNALQQAVSGNESLRATKLLLALGADPNLCGNFALFSAIQCSLHGVKQKPEVVAMLLKAGADVNAVRYNVQLTPLGAAQGIVCSGGSTFSEIDCVRRGVVGTLLRAGATIQPRHAADPGHAVLEDIEVERWASENEDYYDAPLRIAYARELSMYLRAVLAAGGFEKYGQARRAPFVAMLDCGLSLPRDAVSVVCEFWLRVGEYHPGTDALIHFC